MNLFWQSLNLTDSYTTNAADNFVLVQVFLWISCCWHHSNQWKFVLLVLWCGHFCSWIHFSELSLCSECLGFGRLGLGGCHASVWRRIFDFDQCFIVSRCAQSFCFWLVIDFVTVYLNKIFLPIIYLSSKNFLVNVFSIFYCYNFSAAAVIVDLNI